MRKYVVKEVQDAPRTSHLSHLFPECIYTLARQIDGKLVRVLVRKSTGWKTGDILELDDGMIRSTLLPR